ncbi:MAG TPA: hypothetical protein VH134_15385 [Candidatus Dormibacteraeota bacterium]|nr:hypothetical protein [Candidatus Dormibacteraeota bacterium]
MGIAAIATAAVLGSTAVSLTSHASKAHGGSASSKSSGGAGGTAKSSGGTGGSSTGGNGILCGVLSGIASNDLNNILGGQNQLLNGANLLNNLFVPVLSPGSNPNQNSNAGGSSMNNNRGASTSGSTGNAACGGAGDGGSGGKGGSATGGSGGKGGSSKATGGSAKSKISD